MSFSSDPARQEVERALADCQGNRDAALLLLGHLLTEAKRGMSAGLRRLPPADRR